MNPEHSPPEPIGLRFANIPIRSAKDAKGFTQLSSVDICRALKLKRYDEPWRWTRKLPAHQRGSCPIHTYGGTRYISTVSPHGALALTKQRKRRIDAQVRRWLREEVLPLVPEGAADKPSEPLAIPQQPVAMPRTIPDALRTIADALERGDLAYLDEEPECPVL